MAYYATAVAGVVYPNRIRLNNNARSRATRVPLSPPRRSNSSGPSARPFGETRSLCRHAQFLFSLIGHFRERRLAYFSHFFFFFFKSRPKNNVKTASILTQVFNSEDSLTGPTVLGFAVIGFLAVLFLICDVLLEMAKGCAAHLLPLVMPDRTPLSVKYGKWAVVTGSTDGIGKEYAKELAKRGLNIVLISRSIDKLNKIASEIEQEFNVEVKVIQADFSKGQIVFDHITRELEDIEIGILINNVGMQYLYPMYITEVPESTVWDLVNVNVGATTHMTKVVLPGMQKRKRGAIVNVSSSAELQPMPLLAVYAATKSYIKSFTEALRIEYGEDNITVQHLFPLFVNTKMNAFSYKLQETTLFVPDAKMYATNAVNTLGMVDHSTGYWAHGIQHFFMRLPPVWIRTLIGEFMTHSFRSDYFSKKGFKVE